MEGPDYKEDGLTPYSTWSPVHTGQCTYIGMDAYHTLGWYASRAKKDGVMKVLESFMIIMPQMVMPRSLLNTSIRNPQYPAWKDSVPDNPAFKHVTQCSYLLRCTCSTAHRMFNCWYVIHTHV